MPVRTLLASGLVASVVLFMLGAEAQAPSTPDRAVSITAGDGQACAVTERGRVFCWGNNRYGGVGAATETCARGNSCATGPVEVPVRDVVEASATLDGTCARRRDGSVVCWGILAGGEPRVTDIVGARSLQARTRGVCATRASGSPSCIGGDLSEQRTLAPNVTPPRGTTRPRGPGTHACTVVNSRLLCWGSCSGNECGPALHGMVDTPTVVEGLDDVHAVALGNNFTCVLRGEGDVVCFGDDRSGALGDGVAARATGFVHVALPLSSTPPPEHVLPRDDTPPILHVCDAATTTSGLTEIAIEAFRRGGAPVDVYLREMRGDTARILADARHADATRCTALIRILRAAPR